MEQPHQNDPAPPYSRPAGGDASGPEIIVTNATPTSPQQPQQEMPEKIAIDRDQNVNIVPIDAPATIVPVPEAPRVKPLEQLGQESALIDCPSCQFRTTTKVQEENSSQTTMAALFCCIFCGCIGALIPLLCKWSQDYHHFCSHCGFKVAICPDAGPVQVQVPRGPQASATGVPSRYPEAPAKPEPIKTT
ncbi:hypothetical protein FE257_006841 [Aspergillus nanangensis]|uniref:LITAF domain-containing protein n=1 Tax=Aspergillus nanangensis TaxID=2582783 RepID=A0AAD4CQN3_ASPNN|nr:hypothetical protein FE257_006841 [Aspergillus nanangensis]